MITSERVRLIPTALFAGLLIVILAPAFGQQPPEEKEEDDATTTPARPPFVIGLEDRLSIFVYGQNELSRSVTVRPDGKITVPLVGDVVAEGHTPTDLGQRLTEALSAYIRDPVVTVSVEQINHFKIYVLGEVGGQGEMQLSGPTRILQVIAKAGGLSPYADRSNIQILRYRNGKETRIRVDYKKIINGGDPEMNVMLEPGDVILVK